MRRTATGLMAVAALLFAAGLSAQGKPSFSGKWVRDMSAAATPAGGGAAGGQRAMGGGGTVGFNCGLECNITQDATSLKVERAQGDTTYKSEFKLDGSPSKNQVPGQGGMTDVISVAKWDGNRITITTKRDLNVGGNAMTITSVQTLAIDGGNLVIDGTSDRGQGPQPSPKVTYKKG